MTSGTEQDMSVLTAIHLKAKMSTRSEFQYWSCIHAVLHRIQLSQRQIVVTQAGVIWRRLSVATILQTQVGSVLDHQMVYLRHAPYQRLSESPRTPERITSGSHVY